MRGEREGAYGADTEVSRRERPLVPERKSRARGRE